MKAHNSVLKYNPLIKVASTLTPRYSRPFTYTGGCTKDMFLGGRSSRGFQKLHCVTSVESAIRKRSIT